MKTFAILAVAASLVSAPAFAKDRLGYRAIAAGDLVTAEQTLKAERRIYPQRPELMLNLAFVYAQTGRISEARTLYRGVLSEAPVMLELPAGDALLSHALANAGLSRVGGSQIVAR